MAIENPNIEVVADQSALIKRSQQIVVDLAKSAIADHDRFTIALSGGSTPKSLYEALAEEALPWSKIHVFWGDERYVPANHPDSNQLMAREAWLDKIEIPAENIHPMDTNGADPQQDAQSHETHIREFFQQPTGVPTVDLILLGMGDDGHTASLFPHTEALTVSDRLITVGNKDGQPRLTFTVPFINQANYVLFMVAGASKNPALQEIFAPQGDSNLYPSRLIQPQGKLLWLLDQSAYRE